MRRLALYGCPKSPTFAIPGNKQGQLPRLPENEEAFEELSKSY